jgi:hypothetical protein
VGVLIVIPRMPGMREMRAAMAVKYFMVERVVVVCERVVRWCRGKEEELKRS